MTKSFTLLIFLLLSLSLAATSEFTGEFGLTPIYPTDSSPFRGEKGDKLAFFAVSENESLLEFLKTMTLKFRGKKKKGNGILSFLFPSTHTIKLKVDQIKRCGSRARFNVYFSLGERFKDGYVYKLIRPKDIDKKYNVLFPDVYEFKRNLNFKKEASTIYSNNVFVYMQKKDLVLTDSPVFSTLKFKINNGALVLVQCKDSKKILSMKVPCI